MNRGHAIKDALMIGGQVMLSCALSSCATTQPATKVADGGLLLDALTAITTQRGDGFDDIVKALRKNGELKASEGPVTLADGTRLSKWATHEKNGGVTSLTLTVAPSDCIALNEVVAKTYARLAFAHGDGFAFEAIGVRGGFSAHDHDRACLGHLTLNRATPAESQSDEAERATGRVAFSRVLDLLLSSEPADLEKASAELEQSRNSGLESANKASGDAQLLRLRSHSAGGKIFGISLTLAAKPCFPIDQAAARTDARAFPRQDQAVVYEAHSPGSFTTIYPHALDGACMGSFVHYRQEMKRR
ncbi:hypothetical protein [Lysobacter sp. Root690]|uniref:hypothetical protein n=1 Tax=Lysobacter sp. Root690 TaxID=1736588 RepID=UPI000AF45FBA|nr:hypothetical protein [Lysobacter sp. Root690]